LGGTSLLDGRFHVTAAAEYEHNGGIGDLYHRAWGRQEWGLIANPTPGNGLPQYLIAPHVVNSTMSATGLITSGPLKGTTFTPSGTPIPFTYGTLAGSTSMIGGSGQSFFSGFSLLPDSNRRLLYLRMNYDVSDHLNVYTDLNFSQYDTHNSGAMPFDFGDLTIRSDNAFLPASIRQAMANGNIASFGFGRFDTDLGLADDNNNNEQGRALLGVQGDFAGNWTYDASVEYGKFHQKFDFINSFQKARFAQAIDVVTNPANGQVVCRSTLTNPGNGCVPFDPFGSGLNSAAGFGYFLGDQYRRLWYDQAAAAANIQGPLLHLPAGELKVAAGAEFRRDTTRVEVDSASLQNLWLYGNSKPLQGSFDVKEVYGEVDIPVLKALPLVNAADITAAVRYTDYSTSGAVRTWKLGGDWSVTDWLRFRATRSLDIRAPNLNELYTPSTRTTVSVTDPLQHSQYFTTVVTSGNTSLKPEEAHNFTAGIVLEPVKNLSFTLDYFDINLTGAVASLAGQDILNRCYSGQSSLCGDIVRDGNGTITAINTSNINLTSLKERGLDLEANYRLDLASLVPLPGALNFRALATKTFNYDANDGTQTLHLAGMIESESRIYPMIPYWIANVNVGYSLDPFTALATVRYISNGKYDNTFVQGVTINDNTVPSRTYVDLSASFKAFGNDKDYLEVYGVINNLFDIAPPMEPDASRGVTNFSYYDVIGRAFKIGVRFKY
jgi:outer membrane receptor protein involved in Fe transport